MYLRSMYQVRKARATLQHKQMHHRAQISKLLVKLPQQKTRQLQQTAVTTQTYDTYSSTYVVPSTGFLRTSSYIIIAYNTEQSNHASYHRALIVHEQQPPPNRPQFSNGYATAADTSHCCGVDWMDKKYTRTHRKKTRNPSASGNAESMTDRTQTYLGHRQRMRTLKDHKTKPNAPRNTRTAAVYYSHTSSLGSTAYLASEPQQFCQAHS